MPGYPRLLDLSTLGSFGFVLRGKDPGNDAGFAVSSAGDINNDGYDDFIIGAPLAGTSGAGAVYVVFGKAGAYSNPTFLGSLTPADGFRIDAEGNGNRLGYSVASAGDVNNDGFDDIIVGAERFGTNAIGAAYVLFGKASGFADISLATLAAADGFKIEGNGNIGRLGHSVACAGDINNDGYDDIIVGAPDGSTNNAGSAYVIFGKASGFGTINVLTMAPTDGFAIIGAATSDAAGTSVSSAGDINNDGYDDIVIGAPFHDSPTADAGAAYVVYGKAAGFTTVNLATLAPTDGFKITGNSETGYAVAGAGDYNGDGITDLLVGAPGRIFSSAVGSAYLIFGKTGGYASVNLNSLSPSDGFKLINVGNADNAGSWVSAAGDVNNDGYDDLLVGVPGADGSGGNDTGEAYVIFGKASGFGPVDFTLLLDTEGFEIQGDFPLDRAGTSVTSAGDINNDGYDDIIVGAPDALGGHEGAAYIIYGKSTADVARIDNGATDARYASSYTEDGPEARVIDASATLTSGAQLLTMTVGVTGGLAGDRLTLAGSVPASLVASGVGTGTITFTGSSASNADYLAALSQVRFSSTSDNPTAVGTDLSRTITITVNTDVGQQLIGLTDISVAGVDDPAVAHDDHFFGTETAASITGNVFSNNGSGADADPDSPAGSFTVTEVNGSAANVGNSFILASGAILRVNANGTFTYELNHVFDSTPNSSSGAINQPAFDGFTYKITGGSTATATIEISGVDTDDFLIGPAGPSVLGGGNGNDTYLLDNVGDRVTESVNGGLRDAVLVSFDYILNGGAYVEVLSASSQAGTAPLVLVGNELGQEIYGNAGNNFLQGGGGTDYLIGLGGNDTYFVAGPGDNVVESAGGGTRDTIFTPNDYTMIAGVEVEVLSSSNQSGTGPQTLIGNAFAQEIYGNAGINFIEGGGGADYLSGLGGNDVYVVDSLDDYVGESVGGGRDVVYAQTSYALAAGQEIEVLSASSASGTGSINLTGNNLANELYGNAGTNALNGGAGGDYLVGYGGADTFQFTTALGGGNVDQLADFSHADDTIELDHSIFTGLAPGALPASAFVAGSAAGDTDDRIIYNSANGQILFDADGSGSSSAAILFATVAPGTAIDATDFTVI